jgi:hypothetical protein
MPTTIVRPIAPEPTISDIEESVQKGLEALRGAPLNDQITEALKFLVPAGYRPYAQLEEDGRKKRSTAAASNWNPATGEIVIYFEPLQPAISQSADVHRNQTESEGSFGRFTTSSAMEQLGTEPMASEPVEVLPSQIEECCSALAEAERSGLPFIALKRFRDNLLMSKGYSWALSLAQRQAVLTKAIESGAILTSSIPNPKAPLHPTTTVKLNRESEYARAPTPRFQPIKLRGEGPTASEILLRDRGRL